MGAIGAKKVRKPKSMNVIPEKGGEDDEDGEGGIDKYLVDDSGSDESDDVLGDVDNEEARQKMNLLMA